MVRVSLLLLAACGQEYSLSSVEGPPGAPLPPPLRAPSEPQELLVTHVDRFELGADTPAEVADYLFVIDPSASMDKVVASIQAGMQALSSEGGVFPPEARIAVMNTTPADLQRPSHPHAGVSHQAIVVWDPGFQGLVSAERIEKARELPSPYGERFGLDGCEPWFAPADVNPQGFSCLVAHTQLQLAPLHVEAGLTAFMQLLQRDEPLFRPGAAVNVVFVSDTHDPGIPEQRKHFDELMVLRPSGPELAELAHHTHDLASFRIHAIAPERKCSSERWDHIGPAYLEAALDAGGERLDVCSAEPAEYVDLIRSIAIDGAVPQRPVVPVRKAGDVVQVAVDGEPVGFTLSPSGGAVVLDGVVPERRRRVEVRYRARQ